MVGNEPKLSFKMTCRHPEPEYLWKPELTDPADCHCDTTWVFQQLSDVIMHIHIYQLIIYPVVKILPITYLITYYYYLTYLITYYYYLSIVSFTTYLLLCLLWCFDFWFVCIYIHCGFGFLIISKLMGWLSKRLLSPIRSSWYSTRGSCWHVAQD